MNFSDYSSKISKLNRLEIKELIYRHINSRFFKHVSLIIRICCEHNCIYLNDFIHIVELYVKYRIQSHFLQNILLTITDKYTINYCLSRLFHLCEEYNNIEATIVFVEVFRPILLHDYVSESQLGQIIKTKPSIVDVTMWRYSINTNSSTVFSIILSESTITHLENIIQTYDMVYMNESKSHLFIDWFVNIPHSEVFNRQFMTMSMRELLRYKDVATTHCNIINRLVLLEYSPEPMYRILFDNSVQDVTPDFIYSRLLECVRKSTLRREKQNKRKYDTILQEKNNLIRNIPIWCEGIKSDIYNKQIKL
ncbi:hypothetical protein TetV_504 [Tetraselmis virus 1]|uniref:Uncharacterized protein n=1 Tax=Tetraselmis virus 1 TaxID=2060617 RepID=A0A2P0VNV0_9VIRU|nr:hypothetical protein QJ968_gp550 [Tetraselmis virus 1]AUF82586.1 hypothetical protein TetV_504 [Tetraselmis virus 1]